MEGWRALCSDKGDNGTSRVYVRGRGEQRARGCERGGGGREGGATDEVAGGYGRGRGEDRLAGETESCRRAPGEMWPVVVAGNRLGTRGEDDDTTDR